MITGSGEATVQPLRMPARIGHSTTATDTESLADSEATTHERTLQDPDLRRSWRWRLTGAAFLLARDRPVKDAQFNDQGQAFFPDFKDPLACTDLEVVSFDPATASSTRFQVM